MTDTPLSEAQWQKRITQIAVELGWEWVHFRSERTRYGAPPVIVGTLKKGWPDLGLFRPGRTIYAELKRDGQHPTEEQVQTLALLSKAGAETYIWWPSDEPVIRRLLADQQPRWLPGSL